MTAQIGSRLGPYAITAKLGEGGMGEVYRATDTNLDRQVAIKVLPAAFTADAERLARFEREAKLLAQLHHPNIASIFGLESSAGVRALVMELVEGEELSAVIARGPLPLDQAVAIARQIAEALEAAHERGIVHRDLKPANVKVQPDGTVKVLDFGLAKAMDASSGVGSQGDILRSPTLMDHETEPQARGSVGQAGLRLSPVLANSPTLTAIHGTQLGVILGTAAYMAPEQARGGAVDKRADIWSFGVVLYEMLTGRQLFPGDTVSDTLAAVIRADIDLGALPAGTPGRVRELLARSLDRDPKRRLRDIGEARVALVAAAAGNAMDAPETGTRAPRAGKVWLVAATIGLLTGGALGTFAAVRWRGTAEKVAAHPRRTLRLQSPPRGLLDDQAISPNGRWVAYTAGGSLWIRDLGELEAREIKGSVGAQMPFWSPRSDAIAFATDTALFKVALDDDRPVELCPLTNGVFTGGAWSLVEGIVFTVSRANWSGDVLRVAEGGGEPTPFTRADPARNERRLYRPSFLPDGRTLLYTVTTFKNNDGEVAVDRGGKRTLLGLGNGSIGAVYSPEGQLVFTRSLGRGNAIWAVPFALETLTTTGNPFLVAQGGGGASVSADGALVYGFYRFERQQLVLVDRVGKLVGTIGEPDDDDFNTPVISPDGLRVVANGQDLDVWDIARGIRTQIAPATQLIGGFWLPSSREYAYVAPGGELRAVRTDGGGESRVLLSNLPSPVALNTSTDGAFAVYYTLDAETGRDLWGFAFQKPQEPFVVLRTKANEALPRLSPDGKLVAYESDASGRWEVFVQSFPHAEERIQVSVGGGQQPMWNRNGAELFFVVGDTLMAAELGSAPALHAGTPHALFPGAPLGTKLSNPGVMERIYDVAPDGRRFVVVRGVGMGSSDVVLSEGVLSANRAEVR